MSYRRFLIISILLAALGFAPFGFSMLVVSRCGEMMTYGQTVQKQLEHRALFGPLFNNDHYLYKLALYEAVRPDVAVVGSSTMIPFQARFFSAPFLNCCRTADDLPQLESFLAEMLRIKVPEVVIIGVDFWWFRYQENPAKRYAPNANQGDQWTWAKMWRIYDQFRQPGGKLTPGLLWDVALNGTPPDRIGLMALHDRGFRPDGSYDYGPDQHLMPETREELAGQVRDLLNTGAERFTPSSQTYDSNFEVVSRILDMVEQAGAHAVLILPPVVGELAADLRSRPEEFGYFPQIFDKMEQFRIPLADYHDGAVLDSNFTEFHDVIHGGDVTMMRLLLDLAGRDEQVAAVVDREFLEQAVEQYAGLPRLP